MDFNRIRWQCRRGMLELDLLLNDFFDSTYSGLNTSERSAFAVLLSYPDQTVQRWLLGEDTEINEDVREIISMIRERNSLHE